MDFLQLHVGLTFLSAAIAAGLVVFIFWRPNFAGKLPLAIICLLAALYSLSTASIFISQTPGTASMWENLRYLASAFIPVFICIYALEYTHRFHGRISVGIALLFLLPVMTQLIAWTNPLHGWMADPDKMGYFTVAGFMLPVERVMGPWYWVHAGYSYLMMIFGIGIILVRLVNSTLPERMRAFAIFIGFFIPALFSVPDGLQLIQPVWFKLSPYGLALMAGIVAWAINTTFFQELKPIARGKLIEILPDPVIVVDPAGTIVDLNPVAQAFSGKPNAETLGQPIHLVFTNIPKLDETQVGKYSTDKPTSITDHQGRWYDLRITPLEQKRGKPVGYLIILHDISSRRQSEQHYRLLADSERKQRLLTEALHETQKALTATLDFDEQLDLILAQIRKLTPYDSASIMMIDGQVARHYRVKDFERYGSGWENRILDYSFNIYQVDNLRTMMETRLPYVIPDIKLSPLWVPDGTPEQVHSWIGAPITIMNQVVAFISLDKVEPDYYTDQHAKILSIFAGEVAIALENTRLFKSENEQRKLAEALQDTSRALSSTLHFHTMLDIVLDKLRNFVPYDTSSIIMLDGLKGRLVRWQGFDQFGPDTAKAVEEMWFDIDRTKSLTEVMESRQVVIIPDASNDARWTKGESSSHIRSWIGAPLISNEALIGFISVDKVEPNFYTADHARKLMAFSGQVSLALQNARLYEAERYFSKNLESLHELSLELSLAADIDALCYQAIESGCQRLNFERLGIWFLDLDDQDYLVGTFGIDEKRQVRDERAQRRRKTVDKIHERLIRGPEYRFYEKNEPIRNDVSQTLALGEVAAAGLWDRRSMIGYIVTDNYFSQQPLNDNQIEMLGLYGQMLGHLCTRKRAEIALREEDERYRKLANHLSTINRISFHIATALELSQLLKTLYDELRQVMPVDIFYVAFYDRSADQIYYPAYVEGEKFFFDPENITGYDSNSGFTGHIIHSARMLHVRDTLDPDTILPVKPIRSGGKPASEYLGVPLILHNQVTGVISVQSYQPGVYSEEQIRLVETIAQQVAFAIENARLFEDTQKLAITDPLTGLFNRRHFFMLANIELERSERYQHPLALIMLDIDHFKIINDTFGHPLGDKILEAIALRCKDAMRKIDILGRYGGEEFVILLPETDQKRAVKVAERLRQNIAESKIQTEKGMMQVTISLGICSIKSHKELYSRHSNTEALLEQMIQLADQALLQAKRHGRNRVEFFEFRND